MQEQARVERGLDGQGEMEPVRRIQKAGLERAVERVAAERVRAPKREAPPRELSEAPLAPGGELGGDIVEATRGHEAGGRRFSQRERDEDREPGGGRGVATRGHGFAIFSA